jgi:choice-of-anchor C domain-containing protein
MKRILVSRGSFLFTLTLSILAAAFELRAAPFQNGSFESPVLAPGSGQALPDGSTAITGWRVGGSDIGWQNGASFGVNPVDGAQHIGFNGGNSNPGATITQTFSTTVAQTYSVSFNIGRTGSGSGAMSLLAEVKSSDGALLGSLNAVAPNSPGYATTHTFSFRAATQSSTLRFRDTSSASINVDVLLDNVSVTLASECDPPPSGLIAWWRGENDTLDFAGGNNGTWSGSASYAPGKVGESFDFNGIDSQISFGNTVGNFDTNDFTVDFWIQTTSTRHESIMEKWPFCGYASMWEIRIGGAAPWSGPGRLEADMYSDTTGTDGNAISAGRPINDGLFHHVAFVRSGSSLAFYIDGALDVAASVLSGFPSRINNTADLTVGRSVCVGVDGTSPLTGQMDEIDVFNRALTADEIAAIYHAGQAGKCSSNGVPPSPAGFANGSFESPVLAPGASQMLTAGSTSLTGWTVGRIGLVDLASGPALGVNPVDGTQHISFNGANTPVGGSISQAFSNTVGQTYLVSFYVGRIGTATGTMSLLAEVRSTAGDLLGSLRGVAPDAPGYAPIRSFTFTATTAASTITFTDTSSATIAVDVLLDNVSVSPASVPPPPNALVNNGGFESPPGISTYQEFGIGNNPPGWIIESGTVEIVGPYWQAAEGSQSLDLNGIFEEIGTIYQDVTTVPGRSYKIRFAYAGNPECGPTVAVKSFQVFWEGAQVSAIQFDTTGKSVTNMGWQYYESVVTASGNSSRLRFKSTSPSFCGPTLDDISVTPVGSPPVAGSLLDVDFGVGTASPKTGIAATGQTANDYWNLYSRDDGSGGYRTFGAVSNLKWADGTASAVGLTVANAPGAWHNGTADPMFDVFLYPFDGGNITVTVTNLPLGTYDLYLYGHGGPGADNQNSVFRVGSGSQDYGTKATTTTSGWTSATWEEGQQYVVFRDVSVTSAGQSVTVTVAPGASTQASLNGMQIVQKSTTTPPLGCVPPPPGLVSWWKGEGSGRDSVDDNNATLMNAISFTNGKVGQAFDFNGTDSQISFGNTVGNFGTDDFSVEFWIKTTATAHESVIEKWPRCGYASMWEIRIGGPSPFSGPGRLEAVTESDTAGNDVNAISSGRAINDGSFHHVAFVRRGTTLAFYIDGVLDVATNILSGTVSRINNTADLTVGRSVCTGIDGTSPFNGQMDEISIYNRALTESEIQAIYTAGSAGKCAPVGNPTCVPAPVGLVSWWTGNGNANDIAGGNNGTLQGNATFAEGDVGQGFTFDGNGDGVRIGNPPNLQLQTFTIEAWVKRSSATQVSASSIYGEIVGYGWEGYVFGFRNDGRLFLSKNAVSEVDSTTTITDTNWHHVAITKSGSTVIFLIDGTAGPAVTYDTTFLFYTDLMIGAVNNTVDASFLGQIDELAIYNRALSTTEVQAIYDAGSAGKCSQTSPACVNPASGLVGWWKGDGNSIDAIGTNSGTVSGNTGFSAGIVGEAFSFDGDRDSVVLGNPAALRLQDFAIEAWIKRANTNLASLDTSQVGSIFGYGYGGYTFVLSDGGQLSLGKVGFSAVTSTRSVTDTNWHHVAVTKVAGNVRFYVDGVGETAPDYNPGFYFESDAQIGAALWDGSHPTASFLGLIDEVSVYNRALAAGEVASIFAAGSAGKCAPATPQARALAHWKFDETNGTIAHDSAGTYNGTLSPTGSEFVPSGRSGGALRLNKANNGFVNMGNVLGLENTDFSLVAWVKMAAGDTSDSVILTKHAAYSRNGYLLDVNKDSVFLDNKVAFVEGGSGFASYTIDETPISTTSVNDGNWHQVVATFQAGGMRSIYVDGAPAEGTKLSQPFNQNTVAFLIGGVNFEGIPTSRFDGLIDEVQIYNYSLAAADVDFLFQNPGQEISPHNLPAGDWRLNVIANTGGTCSRNPDLGKYANGATVQVTAVSSNGFAFAGWTGDATGLVNPITVMMDANKTVTATFQEVPARILAVVNPESRQEGELIEVPIRLVSQGDVGGMSFTLGYDANYLKNPQLTWPVQIRTALNQVSYDTPGQIRATFALPATAVPAGTQAVAVVSFRARSVPTSLTTPLTLTLLDVSRPTGDIISTGNAVKSGAASIRLRRVIGDNNANNLLDVGDASIMQRLLTGLEQVRDWDRIENDLNHSANLDSGDVIRVLRAVVGLDPQPQVQSLRISKAGPTFIVSSGRAVLSPDGLRGQPGDLVTVQVRLQGVTTQVAGTSFTLDYPTNALRLVNSQSTRSGAIVPSSAVTLWNVQPAQTDYALQSGRVHVAMSSATPWPTNNGVVAEFTFQAQSGATDQYCWPIQVSGMQLTADGYDIYQVSSAQICFIGRDPVRPSLTAASTSWSADGFRFTLSSDPGLSYSIETSTNLINWVPLIVITNSTGSLNWVDPAASQFGHRFYRAKQQ